MEMKCKETLILHEHYQDATGATRDWRKKNGLFRIVKQDWKCFLNLCKRRVTGLYPMVVGVPQSVPWPLNRGHVGRTPRAARHERFANKPTESSTRYIRFHRDNTSMCYEFKIFFRRFQIIWMSFDLFRYFSCLKCIIDLDWSCQIKFEAVQTCNKIFLLPPK